MILRNPTKWSLANWYRRVVEPTALGLPNWRVVTWFPLLIGIGAAILVVLNISGTSSGAWWNTFGEGEEDPQSILGGPRMIRSDEWLVHQGWVVSQYRQGFPAVSGTFPGGAALTVAMELPAWEWASLFRPHVWGYLLFGLDVGLAWQWWVPAFALVSGCYLLVVTLLPRRAITAAVVACAFYFTPLFQWWYGPSTSWPAAWAMLAMAGTVWMLRTDRLWIRILWAVLVGWLGVTVVISLYVPFILSAFIVFLFFFIGMVLQERPWVKGAFLPMLRRLAPLVAAGVAAVAVFGYWLLSKAGTVDAISSTVYPGQRSELTGQLWAQDPYLTRLGGGVWGQTISVAEIGTLLGANASESATSLLLSVFLLPALVWLIVRNWRQHRSVDWLMVATVACIVLLLVYLTIPGWDWLAKLLLLDRIPVPRLRMAFAVLVPLVFVLVARSVDREGGRRNALLAGVTAVTVLSFNGYILYRIIMLNPEILAISFLWPVAFIGLFAAAVLVFYKRTVATAAVALLVASMAIGAAVNPLYRGTYDLGETEIGEAVIATDEESSGTWVGVGSYAVMGVMMETGVEAYSGVQTYPPEEMWDDIDPDGGDEQIWNRLAHVRWIFGNGEPALGNSGTDVILATFDACSEFAQENVDYVLADEPRISNECLEQEADITQGHSRMQIYRVISSDF